MFMLKTTTCLCFFASFGADDRSFSDTWIVPSFFFWFCLTLGFTGFSSLPLTLGPIGFLLLVYYVC